MPFGNPPDHKKGGEEENHQGIHRGCGTINIFLYFI
jgi:hypothetical protein